VSRDRYRSRRFTRPPQAERAAWSKLVTAARLVADRARGATFGGAHDPGSLLEDMRHLRVGLRAQDFPAPHASAQLMAGALLAQVDAFLVASPETRIGYAAALRETVAVVWDALEDQRTRDAAAWQRQLPASERL
jgi:hypothetical protein